MVASATAWNGEGHDEEENATIGQVVADQPHRYRCHDIARGVERLIATLSPVEQFSTDQA